MKEKSNNTSDLLLLAGIAAAGYVVAKNFMPSTQAAPEAEPGESIYAMVSNPSGAYLFAKTSTILEPLYGHGKNPLPKKLDEGTYIGKTTGITYHEMAQVQTQIDGHAYTYWVSKDDIRTVTAKELEDGKAKSQADLKNIVHSLIDQIL